MPGTEHNLAVVEGLIEALNDHGFERWYEFISANSAEDVVFCPIVVPGSDGQPLRHGVGEVRAYMAELAQIYPNFHYVDPTTEAIGESVVILRCRFAPRDDPAAEPSGLTMLVFEFRDDGMATSVYAYLDDEMAINHAKETAAGRLPPDSTEAYVERLEGAVSATRREGILAWAGFLHWAAGDTLDYSPAMMPDADGGLISDMDDVLANLRDMAQQLGPDTYIGEHEIEVIGPSVLLMTAEVVPGNGTPAQHFCGVFEYSDGKLIRVYSYRDAGAARRDAVETAGRA